MSRTHAELLEALRGLTVSCQAYPGEPLREPRITALMARSVLTGGARSLRIQGLDDIAAVRAAVDVPIVGLWKDGAEGVFITPTLDHAVAVAGAGADVVALDGTRRPRPDGRSLAETIAGLREVSDAAVMADCGSLDDAVAAEAAGADLLGTTLSGYTGERPTSDGPDYGLLIDMVAGCERPVVLEGRVRTPAEAERGLTLGAHAVCVGSAITHPTSITAAFRNRVAAAGHTAR